MKSLTLFSRYNWSNGRSAKHKARQALRHFHAIGYGLRDCEHPLRLDRPATALLPLAKEMGLTFPDSIEVAIEAEQENEKEAKRAS